MEFRTKIVLCLFGSLCLIQFAQGFVLRDDNEVDGGDEIDLSSFGEAIYGYPDEANGEVLRTFSPENQTNPEEMGNYLEGDMLIVKSDGRNGLRATSKRWPNGRVPYRIESGFSQQDLSLLGQAMDEYHSKTCIRFVPYGGERNFIRLTNTQTGCWSSVGMVGGEQDVNLQSPGCISSIGTPIHELMHALGFMHEQNREDRDGAVRINWNNVKPGTNANFEKAAAGTTDAFGVGYDLGSVLHYSANAFSVNGLPTITALSGLQSQMGQRRGFSDGDIAKVNRMYCGGDMAGASAGSPAVFAGASPNKQPNFFELIFNAFRQPKAPKNDEN